jgi:hypothetical protein
MLNSSEIEDSSLYGITNNSVVHSERIKKKRRKTVTEPAKKQEKFQEEYPIKKGRCLLLVSEWRNFMPVRIELEAKQLRCYAEKEMTETEVGDAKNDLVCALNFD